MATRPYLTFLLDSTGVISGSVSKSPGGRQPDDPGELKVIFDNWRITVIGHHDKRTRVLAHARWRNGELDRRKLVKGERALTADEWIRIGHGLAQQILSTARAKRPKPKAAVSVPTDPVDSHLDTMVEQADLGKVDVQSEPMLRLEEPSPRFKAVVWGTMATILIATGVLTYTCTRKPEPEAVAMPAPRPPARPPAPPPPPVEPVEVRIAKASTFTEAIALAKPAMAESSEELGPGAKLFASYAVNRLRWEDVDVAAETSFGHVLKDPQAEGGKRMCAEGQIVGIRRRDIGPRKIHVGTLRVSSQDAIQFVAVGTTGELIRDSKARFCGAVTGNSGSVVSMVGLFDLPENRTPVVEQ